jgi:hypothetical protein
MGQYYSVSSGEILEIDDDLYLKWIESKNPKMEAFLPLPEKPIYDDLMDHPPEFIEGNWIIRNKTEEEIKIEEEEIFFRQEAEVLLNVVESLKDGDGTSIERLKRIERVCAFLIKKVIK